MSKMSKKTVMMSLILLCGIAFVFACSYLFSLRFTKGDVFPEYSSKRKDPMGTSVLAESYKLSVRHDVRQLFLSLDKIPEPQKSTVFITGVDRSHLQSRSEEIDAYLFKGGRLVVCFNSTYAKNRKNEEKSKEQEEEPEVVIPDDKDEFEEVVSDDKEEELEEVVSDDAENATRTASDVEDKNFFKSLGVSFTSLNISSSSDETRELNYANKIYREQPGKKQLPFYSQRGFVVENNEWQSLYGHNEIPILIERTYSGGSIVLSNDSYFISNEGLSKHRDSSLYLSLLGGRGVVYFDETAHGIYDNRNVLWLAKRYKLHILGLNLLIVAGLIIWKNFTSVSNLVLELSDENDAVISQRTNHSGMVNLLKYTIGKKELLKNCFNEWSKSAASTRAADTRVENVKKIISNAEITKQNETRVYNHIVQELSQKDR